MRAPRLFPLLLVPLALTIAGCGETFEASGGSGGSGGSAGGSGGGPTTSPPTGGQGGGTTTTSEGGGGGGPLCEHEVTDGCGQCLVNLCEADLCACTGSSACINFGICLEMAGPEPQFANYEYCWQQHKSGIVLAGSLQACGYKHCEACDFEPVSDCTACEYKKCGDQLVACLGNYKCTGYIACLDACPENDLECLAACGTEHPEGQQLLQAVQLCAKANCPDLCQ